MISGHLGGGKSTLLTALGRRGYITVEEPDRRLVKEEMLGNGLALPLVDETAFAGMPSRSPSPCSTSAQGEGFILVWSRESRKGRPSATSIKANRFGFCQPNVNYPSFFKR
jgi:hypothetical protein